MENIVIELSRYNTSDTDKNSEWTNHLSKNIKIEEGDAIVVKQVFIDTRLIDNTSILIEEDIEWSLYFVYWINNHGINIKLADGPDNDTLNTITPDGLPRVLCTMYNPTQPDTFLSNNTYPLVDKFVVKIPKGTYERAYLASYITKQLEGVKEPQNTNLNDLRWTNTQAYPVFQNNTSGSTAISFLDKNDIEGNKRIVTPFSKPILLANSTPVSPPINTGYLQAYMDSYGVWKPAVFNNFLSGTTNPYLYPNKYVVSSIGEVKDDTRLGALAFGGSYDFDAYEGGYVGTNELSFVYNDENTGKFSFSYMHTPIVNDGNEVVGTYLKQQTTPANFKDKTISFFNAYSGILFVDTFTNLTPKDLSGNYLYDEDPFFSQIGMLYNDIVSPDAKNLFVLYNQMGTEQAVNTGTMTQDNFLSHTTKNYFSLASLTDSSDTSTDVSGYKIQNPRTYYSKVGYNFVQSNITDEVIFSNVPISSTTNAGHFLINIDGYQNEYINDKEKMNIKATISNFYLSGDSFTSSLGPDSYIYTHHGIPMSLNQLKVSILNPVTKEPADNIGQNSTIYLQVYKNIKDELNQNETEKKEQTK
jgi:hypothetical protein